MGLRQPTNFITTGLVSEGVDVKTVSSMVRHSNIKTTLRIYSHAVGSKQLAAQGQFSTRCSATRRSNSGTKSGTKNGAGADRKSVSD
jgi:hypothetical protein